VLRSAALGTLLGAALLPLPSVLRAQARVRAEGIVVRPAGADSLPVAGVRVLLHRIGREAQGPSDSVRTDARGRFALAFRPDTGAVYLLSARYAGLEYFSEPVHTNPARPDTAIVLVVSDTSAAAPVAVEARHIVLSRPEEDGTRDVLDLVVLRNDGTRTRVAPDTLSPSFTVPLPAGVIEFRVGAGELSPEAVERRGDAAALVSPIAPGERQLVLQYALPNDAEALVLPAGPAVASVNVLVEERGARVDAPGLEAADTTVVEGRSYRRWTGALAEGARVRVALPAGARRNAGRVLAGLVAATVFALALAAWWMLRRRRAADGVGGAPAVPSVGPGGSSAAALLDALAALDGRYQGREHEVPADEWARYEAERARLKAALQAALAGRGSAL